MTKYKMQRIRYSSEDIAGLYNRNIERLVAFADYHLYPGLGVTSHDVIHTAFFKTLSARGRHDENGGFYLEGDPKYKERMFVGWIKRVIRNEILDSKRRNVQFDFIPTIEMASTPEEKGSGRFHILTAPTVDIAGILHAESIFERISQYLGKWGKGAEYFRRHYFEYYTHSEIAEMYGVPVGTVKSHISHTKRKLKKELEREWYGLEDLL